MALRSLDIKNFQAHSHFKISLDPHLTTIVGPSDVGKSAVLRALRWLALNAPQGDAFVKHGEKATEVSLVVDGSEIVRRRGRDGENSYHLDGKEFKAFGTNVPDTISDALALDNLNFVGQHTPVFWFSETAGEVSRQINQVVDLGIIDKSLYNIGRETKKRSDDLRICKESLEQSAKKLEDLVWVSGCDADFQSIESLGVSVEGKTEGVKKLSAVLVDLRESERLRDTANETRRDVAIVGRVADKCLAAARKFDELSAEVKSATEKKSIVERGDPNTFIIDERLADFEWIGRKFRTLAEMVSSAKSLKAVASVAAPSFDLLDDIEDKYCDAYAKSLDLESLLSKVAEGETALRGFVAKSEKCAEDLERETEGKCPICGSELRV